MIGVWFALTPSAFALTTTFCGRMPNAFEDADVGDQWTSSVDYVPLRGVRMTIVEHHPITQAPTTSETKYISPAFAPSWAALAVGAHALYLGTGGLTDEEDCGCGECDFLDYATVTDGYNGSNQTRIRVGGDNKFLYAHETGHGYARRRDDCQEPERDWDAAGDDTCDATAGDNGVQDGTIAREYQSVALVEGWANFFAMWMWNTRASACHLSTNEEDDIDLDLDGDDPEHDPDLHGPLDLNCEGVPLADTDSYITSHDWLQNLLDHTNAGTEQCSLTLSGVGTPLDVARYLWDMYTDGEGKVSFAKLIDLYDASDPRSWAPGVDTIPYDDQPYIRWRDAAYAHPDATVYTQHVAERSNGLDHGPGQ